MDQIFFSGWDGLIRTLIVGIFAYIGLVTFLRWSGKRTLSKMNAFDFIVTVSLGSTLATVLLSKNVVLAEGLSALALLIVLQFVVTWLSVRIRWVRKVITGEPQILMRRGMFVTESMRKTRVAESEIYAAVRSAGFADLTQVAAVVLETDGSFSVVPCGDAPVKSSLADIQD